jgi:CheY-like chemotaxis protein
METKGGTIVGTRLKTAGLQCELRNVFDLSSYRARKFNDPMKKILLLSPSTPEALPVQLPLSPALETLEIQSEENLVASLPDSNLILMNAQLDWADPITLISTIHKWNEAPIVLVCPQGERFAKLIKQAYAAGISDILYAPVEPTDVIQILDVFLGLPDVRASFERLS